MDNILIAVNAVVPFLCYILFGYFVRVAGVVDEPFMRRMNQMVFRVFFPIMMFYNLYHHASQITPDKKLILVSVISVLLTILAAFLIVPRIVKENAKRGVIIQALYRSNFVIMGIPIISNIFGDDQLAIPTMMIAIIVPIYNIVSVFILETFRGGRFYLPGILLGVLKNPMILGAILGFSMLLLGIPLPKVILKPISQLAAATTPMALIVLGASFKAGSYHDHLPQLIGCVAGRLVIVPTIMLGLAIFLGFRGIELVTLMAIFATPCAVAGYAMAQQMGSDADLVGNCVVYTTGLSCFTIFGWVFVLKTLGLF